MDAVKTIMDVVRGETHWSTINQFGFKIKKYGDTWIFPPISIEPIFVDIKDIAFGLLKLQNNQTKLQEWASFLLAADSFISFENFSNFNYGEIFLDALWEICFEGVISENVIILAKNLVTIQGNKKLL